MKLHNPNKKRVPPHLEGVPTLTEMWLEMQRTREGLVCIDRAVSMALLIAGDEGAPDELCRILLVDAYRSHQTMRADGVPSVLPAVVDNPSPPKLHPAERRVYAVRTTGPDLESRAVYRCLACGQVSVNGMVENGGTPCPECITW